MTIDARGKACPQPVVLALHALAELKEGENLEEWVRVADKAVKRDL